MIVHRLGGAVLERHRRVDEVLPRLGRLLHRAIVVTRPHPTLTHSHTHTVET